MTYCVIIHTHSPTAAKLLAQDYKRRKVETTIEDSNVVISIADKDKKFAEFLFSIVPPHFKPKLEVRP